jgi:uncharacterized protein (DUF1800 family)
VTSDRARRVIDRATWGWTPSLDDEVRDAGWEVWLDQQLAPSSISDTTLQNMLSGYTTLSASNASNYALATGMQQNQVIGELSHATALRMTYSRRQLYEVMVDFWTNHFNVMVYDAQNTIALKTDNDRDVARPHALGRFADLLVADAKNPAMLVYLDQWLSNSNSTQGVNVNFARETLELHTLGIVDGVQPYAETDVRGLANVLSGFSINYPNPDTAFTYRADYHKSIAVSLLGGDWSTPGHAGAAGEPDALSALDFLAHRPETARHLAWKLGRRFVADDPPDDLVDELAAVYLDNDTEIVPVLRTLFHSDAFFDAGPKYRRGLEAVIAALRATAAVVDPSPTGPAVGVLHAGGFGILARVGQPLFRHQDPDGYPDTRADWLGSDSALKRWQWNGVLSRSVVNGFEVDLDGLVGSPTPATAGALVDTVVARLLGTLVLFPDPGFSDVATGHAFYAEIAWMADAGISTGYADGTYRPGDPVTRQAMSAFLYRLEGEPAFTPPGTPTFTDVGTGHSFFKEIEWMNAEGITTGYPGGLFKPGLAVTRQAMSAFLYRLEGEPAFTPPGTPTFTDVGTGHSFFTEIEWMAATGISTGYSDRTYRPDGAVTRAAMSAFLYRAADVPPTSPLPELDRSALVAFLGAEATPVTSGLLASKLADLVALTLSTPTFQHR